MEKSYTPIFFLYAGVGTFFGRDPWPVCKLPELTAVVRINNLAVGVTFDSIFWGLLSLSGADLGARDEGTAGPV